MIPFSSISNYSTWYKKFCDCDRLLFAARRANNESLGLKWNASFNFKTNIDVLRRTILLQSKFEPSHMHFLVDNDLLRPIIDLLNISYFSNKLQDIHIYFCLLLVYLMYAFVHAKACIEDGLHVMIELRQQILSRKCAA